VKEYLAAIVAGSTTPLVGRNLTREYLQARILASLQHAGAMIPLALQGGTALRFLYHLPRYSEDLDFTLEQARDSYDFHRYLRIIHSSFSAEGYDVAISVNDRKVVHSAFVRFPGLLYDLGLSRQRAEVLSVKIEVDTSPPSGAILATTLIRRHVTLHLQHHDKTSLFAGKLHAVLSRSFLKGRDVYDLLWYLSDPNWPEPNLALLNNALQQTGWQGETLVATSWRALVRARLQGATWDRVMTDVQPFLEAEERLDFLSRDHLFQLLS